MPYTEEIAAALDMITEAGVLVTITRRGSGGAINMVTDRKTGGAAQSTSARAVAFPPDSGDGEALAPETQVGVSTRHIIIAASGLTFVPLPGDDVGPIEGRTWRFGPIAPLAPDG